MTNTFILPLLYRHADEKPSTFWGRGREADNTQVSGKRQFKEDASSNHVPTPFLPLFSHERSVYRQANEKRRKTEACYQRRECPIARIRGSSKRKTHNQATHTDNPQPLRQNHVLYHRSTVFLGSRSAASSPCGEKVQEVLSYTLSSPPRIQDTRTVPRPPSYSLR